MDIPLAYCFDGWSFHPRSGELLRPDRRVLLQTQPAQLLHALLELPGDVVTREQLIARLWPSGVVDYDTALNSTVRRLRAALGDEAETPRYIETLPRRGYRFIGRLEADTASPPATVTAAPVPRVRRARAAALGAAVLVAAALGYVFLDGAPVPTEPATSEASSLVGQAQFVMERRGPGDLESARRNLQRAVELEPGLAQAWATLASAYWLLHVHGERPDREGLVLAREAAQRALAIEPDNVTALVRLANVESASGRLEASRAALDRAAVIQPEHPMVLRFLAGDAAEDGDMDLAIQRQRRVLAQEPLAVAPRYNLVLYLICAERLDDAEREARAILELDPSRETAYALLGRVLVLGGRYPEVLKVADQCEGDCRHSLRAMALHALGQRDAARRELDLLSREGEGNYLLELAEILEYTGHRDEALAVIARLDGDGPARLPDWYERYSPFLRALREDPRWLALVSRAAPL